MSRYDAERALTIYKTFTKQTNQVVEYLSTARMYEHATRLEIPKLKHAPTSLAGSLEEYLNDKDFEVNRRQYLAQLDAKKNKKSTTNGTSQPSKSSVSTKPEASKPITTQSVATKPESKGPAPDLIDFFDSIEQNQQPMTFGAPQQNTGFQSGSQFQQQFPQQQSSFISQQNVPQQQLSRPTNNSNPHSNPFGQPPQQQLPAQSFGPSGFDPFQQQQQQPPQQNSIFSPGQNGFGSQQPLDNSQSQSNAFVNGFTSQPQQQPFTIQQQPTGQQSTNPFRQSMFPQPTGATSSPFSSAPPTSNPLSYQSTSSSFPSNTNTTSQMSYQPTSSSLQNGMNNNSFTPSSPKRSSTNPFARNTTSPFTSAPPPQPQQQQQQQSQPHPLIQPQRTGTNPFARSTPPPSSAGAPLQPLMPHQTGSTNPFRQSTFPTGGAGTAGGNWGTTTLGGAPMESVPTIPVFPRPGDGSGVAQGQQGPQQQQLGNLL